MSDIFDEMFDAVFGPTFKSMSDPDRISFEKRYCVPSFPPCNLDVAKDGSMIFTFALAGYKKEDLQIDFDGNAMILSTVSDYAEKRAAEEKERLKGIKQTFAKNIKLPSFSYKYGVPETKFKTSETKAAFEDGILTIVIPPAEKKEKLAIKIK